MAKRQKAKSIKTLIKNYGIMWRRDSVFWDSPRGQTKKKTPQKRGRYSCSALCMDNPWGDRGGRGALALFDPDAVTAQEVKQIKLIEKHIHGLMAASTPRNPRRVDTACPF